jgi:chloramphenicol 3-O phosphotransferase
VTDPGQIVILNGVPRSGKSSIAAVIQETFPGPWMNLGVDVFARCVTPPRYRPGIGLRPGGERPEVEALVPALYAGLFESVAAHARQGLNVVADVGLHDSYSRPLGVLRDAAQRLGGLPVLFVGVRCPVEVVMGRRDAAEKGGSGPYATSGPHGEIPAPVLRWQDEVHRARLYDLEVDTSRLSPGECAESIREYLQKWPGRVSSFERLASGEDASGRQDVRD